MMLNTTLTHTARVRNCRNTTVNVRPLPHVLTGVNYMLWKLSSITRSDPGAPSVDPSFRRDRVLAAKLQYSRVFWNVFRLCTLMSLKTAQTNAKSQGSRNNMGHRKSIGVSHTNKPRGQEADYEMTQLCGKRAKIEKCQKKWNKWNMSKNEICQEVDYKSFVSRKRCINSFTL